MAVPRPQRRLYKDIAHLPADEYAREAKKRHARAYVSRHGYPENSPNGSAEARRAYDRMKRHGLSQEEYDKMVVACGGKCTLCRRERNLVVDHCHETGKLRGLICKQCNTALGTMGDTPARIKRLLAYVQGDKSFTLDAHELP